MELKNYYIPRSAVILSISTKTCHKIVHIVISSLIKITSPLRKSRSRPGFEPGTSRTLSGNHTPRPTRLGEFSLGKQIYSTCQWIRSREGRKGWLEVHSSNRWMSKSPFGPSYHGQTLIGNRSSPNTRTAAVRKAVSIRWDLVWTLIMLVF